MNAGSIVWAHELRRAVHADQAREQLHHASRTDRAGHVDFQALVRALVDDDQALDLRVQGGGIEVEVFGPALRWL